MNILQALMELDNQLPRCKLCQRPAIGMKLCNHHFKEISELENEIIWLTSQLKISHSILHLAIEGKIKKTDLEIKEHIECINNSERELFLLIKRKKYLQKINT